MIKKIIFIFITVLLIDNLKSQDEQPWELYFYNHSSVRKTIVKLIPISMLFNANLQNDFLAKNRNTQQQQQGTYYTYITGVGVIEDQLDTGLIINPGAGNSVGFAFDCDPSNNRAFGSVNFGRYKLFVYWESTPNSEVYDKLDTVILEWDYTPDGGGDFCIHFRDTYEDVPPERLSFHMKMSAASCDEWLTTWVNKYIPYWKPYGENPPSC